MSSNVFTEKVALSIKTKPSEKIRLSVSRNLSQEFSNIDTSFDVYYRESSVGVPFLWESQPGTPKVKTRESRLAPPLTPPPSFHASSPKHLKNKPRNNVLLLPKLNLIKKTHFQQQSPSSVSISSSSPSSWSSPLNESNRDRVSRMSFDSRFGSRIDEDECESPVSTLCFRSGGRGGGARPRGCSSSIVRLLLGEFS